MNTCDCTRLLEESQTSKLWAEYYRRKHLETLQRLHMAKRRAREDKVKLRNVIASYRESHEELRQIIEDQREYTEFIESLNDPWNE